MAEVYAARPRSEPIVKPRHPGRWITYLIFALVLAIVGYALATNPRFQWGVVGHYFLSGSILKGLLRTIELTAIAMAIGVVLGVVLAVMRLSSNRAMSGFASAYLWFFRGTPVFVQLLFWGYASALYPRLGIGVPFGGHQFASAATNSLITTFTAAILGLGLNEGAYMAEIVRAGILSVDDGQTQAAQALGMSRLRTLRRVVLPQAMRVIIPPTGNQTISMLKTTSLVSVLSYPELLYSAQLIYSTNFKTIPLLITASLWYLLVTTVLSVGQYYLERRFNRGERGVGQPLVMDGRVRALDQELAEGR